MDELEAAVMFDPGAAILAGEIELSAAVGVFVGNFGSTFGFLVFEAAPSPRGVACAALPRLR